ncbi:MAG: hypothetical protein HZA16_08070 [Nitrospirae bacterium]|nr:hypothetical protein [Nitrospirota bacterium]
MRTSTLPLDGPPVQRAAVFAHFDVDGRIDDYVVYLLKNIREACVSVVFVTTSDPGKQEISRIEGLCEKVIVRKNEGHDFMSYKHGLSVLDKDKYDEIVLCNDSVYGPLFPLGDVFNKMRDSECDFWGITENTDLAYHIQSYFIAFKRKVIRSASFGDFWRNVSVENDKSSVIEKYEVGLTRFLVEAGFVPDAYIRIRNSLFKTLQIKMAHMSIENYTDIFKILARRLKNRSALGVNPTRFYWKKLIAEYNMPFIKIDILRDGFRNIDTGDHLSVLSKTDYNTGLIYKHLERVRGRYTAK